MSYYSNKNHKSNLIDYNESCPWLSPELISKKPNLNGILNRIYHTVKIINFILTERDKYVNAFRKNNRDKKKIDDDTFWALVLFTESFFTYAKNMLNAYAELLCEIKGYDRKKVDANFSKLLPIVKKDNKDKDLRDYFQNRLCWFKLLIGKPRNELVSHDSRTSGYSIADHEIDVYVGKYAENNLSDESIKQLQEIISNHQELKDIRVDKYFHPTYRQILEKIDVLEEREIDSIEEIAKNVGYDFPYIPQVIPKLQDFINFVEKWLANRYQMCPICKEPNLGITRFAINPDIQKYDPQNIWYGWKCSTCSYKRKFDLDSNS